MNISVLSTDLFDKSRFPSDTTFINSFDEVSDLCDLLIVDIDKFDNFPKINDKKIKLVGYGSHVNKQAFESALSYGFDQVMPRSQFFSQIDKIIADL